jgi:DNA polymerase III delta' subunit
MKAASLLPIGHQNVLNHIRLLLEGEKVGQSYLFVGREGIGKYLVARWFAAGLLCRAGEKVPCLNCESCQRVEKGLHVDLKELSPEKGIISIDAVREAQDWLFLKPMEGRRKALLIDDAHTMNIPAANAFLKTLEEPPSSAVIVLVTANPMWLLPTIRSRCQVVRFSPLSSEELEEILKRKGKAEVANSRFAVLCEGSPGKLLEIASTSNLNDMEHAARLLLQGEADWRLIVGRYIRGKKRWVREKEEVKKFLLLLHWMVRERMLEGNAPERVVALHNRLTLLEEEIFMYNLNPQLVMESLLGV